MLNLIERTCLGQGYYMSEVVTLELPDVVAQNARAIAEQTHRRVEDVLIEWLDRVAGDVPVEQLSDEQVLALRDLQMNDDQQVELSELLARQREGILNSHDRARLDELMSIYRRGMVRKARALQVAVARGLQAPERYFLWRGVLFPLTSIVGFAKPPATVAATASVRNIS